MHRLEEHLLERPELARVINNVRSLSPEAVYAFDVLNVFSHAYDMRERKVLNDNEWFGWVEWMRNCFRLGTIKEHWNRMQENHWYDATFEDFINKKVIANDERENRYKSSKLDLIKIKLKSTTILFPVNIITFLHKLYEDLDLG